MRNIARSLSASVRRLGFDAEDTKTVVALSIQALTIVAYAATFGLALRVFLATSGIGRVFGWEF